MQQALAREVKEEVGLHVSWFDFKPATFATKFWEPTQLLLLLFVCRKFKGEAAGMEGQAVQWVSFAELTSGDYPMCNADEAFRRWLAEFVGTDGSFQWARFERFAELAGHQAASKAREEFSGRRSDSE